MKDIKTVGDAIDYSERTIEALRLKAEELDRAERAAFEAKAAPVIADLSQMVPDPELRARFGKQLEEPYPPGAGSEVLIAALQSGNDDALNDVLAQAEEAGMDSDELVARITAGGTKNYGMAQDWVERDMNAVLAKTDSRLRLRMTTSSMARWNGRRGDGGVDGAGQRTWVSQSV